MIDIPTEELGKYSVTVNNTDDTVSVTEAVPVKNNVPSVWINDDRKDVETITLISIIEG